MFSERALIDSKNSGHGQITESTVTEFNMYMYVFEDTVYVF